MIPMDMISFREALINKDKVHIPKAPRDIVNGLCNYWTKNMIRFECSAISRFGDEDAHERTIYHLNPIYLPISSKTSTTKYNQVITHLHAFNPFNFWKLPTNIKDVT